MDWVGMIPGVRLTIALTLAATWINVFLRWKYLTDTYDPMKPSAPNATAP